MDDNPYAPPKAQISIKDRGDGNLLQQLRYGSTWKLLGLGVITLGIYFAHYILKQTKAINKKVHPSERISGALVYSILISYYLSVILFIPPLINEDLIFLEKVSDSIDNASSILTIIWGFKARNRMNQLLNFTKSDSSWFNGLWTFFASPLYFNYKVNWLNQYGE